MGPNDQRTGLAFTAWLGGAVETEEPHRAGALSIELCGVVRRRSVTAADAKELCGVERGF